MDSKIKIVKVKNNATLPLRATNGSAGYDLFACIDNDIELKPGEIIKIPTGIAIELPNSNMAAFIFARSGLGVNHGITLANGVGLIDSDYRGEIKVGLYNISNSAYTIKPFERIAQLVVMPVHILGFEQVDYLQDSQRGSGGFGSTNNKKEL